MIWKLSLLLRAIQILSDTFLTYFNPPFPMSHMVTLAQTPHLSSPRDVILIFPIKLLFQKRAENVTWHFAWPPPSPMCYSVTLFPPFPKSATDYLNWPLNRCFYFEHILNLSVSQKSISKNRGGQLLARGPQEREVGYPRASICPCKQILRQSRYFLAV